ncbi:MFS transporter [Streptomyces sp. NPDC046831]|uniref:MFS transporter n=1 Tax=Streptomyces sp. NPDC046831 TaxID=3154805 RepID=UPI0033FF3BFD
MPPHAPGSAHPLRAAAAPGGRRRVRPEPCRYRGGPGSCGLNSSRCGCSWPASRGARLPRRDFGGASDMVPVHIAEVAPRAIHGRLMVLFQLTVAIGRLIPYLCGRLFAGSGGWRVTFGLAVLAMQSVVWLIAPEILLLSVRAPATSLAALAVRGFDLLIAMEMTERHPGIRPAAGRLGRRIPGSVPPVRTSRPASRAGLRPRRVDFPEGSRRGSPFTPPRASGSPGRRRRAVGADAAQGRGPGRRPGPPAPRADQPVTCRPPRARRRSRWGTTT